MTLSTLDPEEPEFWTILKTPISTKLELSSVEYAFNGDGISTHWIVAGQITHVSIQGVLCEYRHEYRIVGPAVIFAAPPPCGTVISIYTC